MSLHFEHTLMKQTVRLELSLGWGGREGERKGDEEGGREGGRSVGTSTP